MANLEAFQRYLDAKDAYHRGDREEATLQLVQALGQPSHRHVVRDNLDILMEHDSLAGEMVLDLLRVEVNRRSAKRSRS